MSELGITSTQLGTDQRCTDMQFRNSLPISNGLVCYNETTAMSEAFYICNDNFTLHPMGDAKRVCQNDGNWNGNTPQCIPGIVADIIMNCSYLLLCKTGCCAVPGLWN